MDYEKKYKDVLERAKKELDTCGSQDCDAAKQLFRLFPELKESEDERTRKHLISLVKNWDKDGIASKYTSDPNDIKQILAWLEKQDKEKPVDKVEPKDYNSIDPHFGKPIDKVEPKFHEGDWIIDKESKEVFYISKNLANTYKIVDIEGNDYHVPHYTLEEDYDVWSLNDAKDGDVLVCPFPKGYETGGQIFIFKEINSRDYVDNCIEYYCRVCEGVFYENKNGYMGTTSSPLYPATKEQRDLLFAKMKEAGYEWDAEKKDLKKIDNEEVNGEDYGIDGLWHAQRILEKTLGKVDGYQTDDGLLSHQCAITAVKKLYKKKPVEWSEEDERIYQSIIDDTVQENQLDSKQIDWLKSIKSRVQPKQEWSEEDKVRIEQICDDLECGLENFRSRKNVKGLHFEEIIESNIDWLKSLKYRIQPKQEWNEDDESLRLRTIGALETCKIGSPTKCVDEQINWLKSLKGRVQPKQEWSDEDETERINTIIMLKEGASLHFNKKNITKAVDWLKSLKQRIGG